MADENEKPTPAADLPSGQYWYETAKNFPSNAYDVVKSAAHALAPWNWQETASGLGAVTRGGVSNVLGEPAWEKYPQYMEEMKARGMYRAPEERKKDIEAANMFGKEISGLAPPVFNKTDEGWKTNLDTQSPRWREFWQTLHDRPADVASVVSAPISMGGGALAEGANIASKVPIVARAAGASDIVDQALNIARTTGNVLEKAKYADPTTAALESGKLGVKGVTEVAKMASGVPEFKPIMDLFSVGGKEGGELRDIFNAWSKGGDQLDHGQLLDDVNDAVDRAYDKKITQWGSKKGALRNSEIPLMGVRDAFQEAIDKLGNTQVGTPLVREAVDQLTALRDGLNARIALPAGDRAKLLPAVDQYKQEIYTLMKQAQRSNPQLADALRRVHSELRGTLTTGGLPGYLGGDPEYSSLMKDYQDILDFRKNMESATGANMSDVAQFRRLMSSMKSPVGKELLSDLFKENPKLGAAFLGASSPSTILPSGTMRRVADLGTMLALGGGGLLAHPVAPLVAGAMVPLSSPAVTSGAPKIAGALERNALTRMPKRLVEAAPTAARAISPFAHNMEEAYNKRIAETQEKNALEQLIKLQEQQGGQNAGGRIGHATGGRTVSSAKAKADRLISMVDRVRKEESNGTKPLLNLDDTTVAKALSIANRGI